MLVPLLVLVVALGVALAVLLGRLRQLRARVAASAVRLAEVEARVDQAAAALRDAMEPPAAVPVFESEVRPETAERRPGRRRVRRVGPPATPDRS